MVESCACRRMSDSALCLWEACMLVTLEMQNSGIYYMSLTFFFSSFPSILFPFSHPPLFLTFFIFHFNVSFLASFIPLPLLNALLQFSRILPSSALIRLSHTIRLVSLPEQLQFKRCQSCFSANCLWSGFTLRSADEASSRKIS